MQPRMKHPAFAIPGAMDALQALSKATEEAGLPPNLLQLVQLRASQIDGCSACVDRHAKILKQLNEPDDRLFAVSAWRDTPYFSDPERAALALTESLTRIADHPDPVPNEIYNEATKHFPRPQQPHSSYQSPPSTLGIASTQPPANKPGSGNPKKARSR